MLVLACALCLALGGGEDVGATHTSPVVEQKGKVRAEFAFSTVGTQLAASAGSDSSTPDAASSVPTAESAAEPSLIFPGEERHLRNIRQLTFGHSPEYDHLPYPANYAEAYWSPDGTKLILQATRDEYECDQMFVLDLITGGMKLVSTGTGRVTCGFFFGGMDSGLREDGKYTLGTKRGVIYSSTHETMGSECPPRPDMSRGYVWPLYDYDIYLDTLMPNAYPQGPVNITRSPGYDAEGTIDWRTNWLYFTSTRDNDIDIYRMNLFADAGTPPQRLTNSFGYDGGPFISYDGKTVVFRRQVFESDAERAEFSELLAQKLVRPNRMELWAMDSDGGNQRQLTSLGGANFAPFLHPDNETVIFCSNYEDTGGGRTFHLYTVPLSGGEVEQVTFSGEFDGFPMFSPDGKYLAWCSNRNGSRPRETNVFVAEWIP